MSTFAFRRSKITFAFAALVALAVGHARAVPMTNLQLWTRADAGVEISPGVPATADGNLASIWRDQSGNSRDLFVGPPRTFVTPAAPTYDTNDANGQPAIVFGQGFHQLQASSATVLSGTTDFSIFTVAQTTGGGEKTLGTNYGVGSPNGLEFYINGAGIKIYLMGVALEGGTNASNGAFHVFSAERVSGVVTLKIDNVQVAQGALAGSILASHPWTLHSGTDYSGNAIPSAPYRVGETLVYNSSLNTADRLDLLGYMFEKYDLAIVGIPEPTSLALFAIGFVTLGRATRRGK